MDNNLTKREKYLLKKQKKEQEHLLKARRKKINNIIKISLIILVLGAIAFGIFKYIENRNFGTPKIEITNLEYDAGTVFIADGLVEHTYEIKNIGEGDLKIKKIWTSCMCTTARFRDGNKIVPGETGYLDVVFDPAFHGSEGVGPVTRAVYISTNDPENKEVEFLLLANVTE